ncbi:MAG: phospho-N-acetylmuramoyl-pentapeptide-transferase [Lactobacillaceae bacterium]|jgi:phospho-N-acetylmuramoyl-pentapeptide-transferase|nr:phospho-N-acetylmuramoyl-pentapeptide-transferase [Lactobacillaceae bacterium]
MTIWLAGLITAFLATLIVVPVLRDWFKKIKVEQLVMRENANGPDHGFKVGTPTMGGAGFIPVVVVLYIVLALIFGVGSFDGWAAILAIVAYAVVGAFDDSIKIFNHRDEGFRFLPKLFAQIGAAVLAVVVLALGGFNFVIHLPFGLPAIHNVVLFALFAIVWLVGWSNATNLTDGLDGLATGLAIIAYFAYLLVALYQGNQAVVLLDALLVGALIAFFAYNHYPASIFMGDTGSLALGAGLAMNALVLHVEWSLLLIGLVFMLDTLTVIIQVLSFHFRGKRVFLMTPIHHAFEKGGITMNLDKPWSEWQVDGLFWAVGVVGVILYFSLF